MECPKCGAEIDKSTVICPNCKKVLKIQCPVCKTLNTKNICKKCGEVLVVKCNKCGKTNMMQNPKCKCGFSNEISAVLNESNTEEFAVLRIDFPNAEDFKLKLGSNQLYSKFKASLDGVITRYTDSVDVRRQVFNNKTYIIRFNKDYTFSASANSAMKALIEYLNIFTKLNVKLIKKKDFVLKCNFCIMKRLSDQDPTDIDSKFKANMMNQSTATEVSQKALEAFQITTDEIFYDIFNATYKMELLDSALVDGVMKRFYQMDMSSEIKIDEIIKAQEMQEKAEKEDEPELPNFVHNAMLEQYKVTQAALKEENELVNEEAYNHELINFEEVNCAFFRTESMNAVDCVIQTLKEIPSGILAIKAAKMYQPYTLKLLTAVSELDIYDNIIPVTCHDDMIYSPFSFFRELVSSIFEYTISAKLFDTNDFSMFAKVDHSGLMKDLITLTQREMSNMEKTREEYFNMFLDLLSAIPNSLIYIENFEKIDTSSMFVLEQLFEHFSELKISYLVSYDKDYSLHKNVHFLLSLPFYTEVSLSPTPFELLVNTDKEFYKNIMEDFYFQRISKYAYGSTLFLDFAIQYLVESGIYQYTEDDAIELVNAKTIIIPAGLDKLIMRRINLLKEDADTIKFFTMIILLGTRVDIKTIESLGVENWKEIIEKLSNMGYTYEYGNCIYFSNYAILKNCLLEVIKTEDLQAVAIELFDKVFTEEMANPAKAYLYDTQKDDKKVIEEWEKLANINLSMGDFPSYLNCSSEIHKALNKYSENWTPEDLEKYQQELYNNVAENMFEYNPQDTVELAESTLSAIQTSNPELYTTLCIKMVQGAMAHGDYTYALNLSHKLLASLDKYSIDPSAQNFNFQFLLMSLIYVKILFNVGSLEDCLNIGYNILNVLDDTKIANIDFGNISKEGFIDITNEAIACISVINAVSLKEDVVAFLDRTKKLLTFVPDEYHIFEKLQKLITGEEISVDEAYKTSKDMFVIMMSHLINAFVSYKNSPEEFAQTIYKAKLMAKEGEYLAFELFCDIMVAYSYIELGSYQKADLICKKIIQLSKEKGLKSVINVAWYILSILCLKEGKYKMAYGVLNNSIIVIERNASVFEYLLMLNKINMFKVLTYLSQTEQAQICLGQATNIVKKYNINYDLNIDITPPVPVQIQEAPNEETSNEQPTE